MRLKHTSISRLILFAALLNIAIAPSIHAASHSAIDRSTAYALGLLLIVVLGLAIYLAIVIIQPERF
jgi:K+-transporting ATPase KdpF subunit